MEKVETGSPASFGKERLERFWRIWAEGVEILQTFEGPIQEAVREAWQQALGKIEMRDVPLSVYEEFVRLRKEYVDFRISTKEFSVPHELITEAAAQSNADAVIRLLETHHPSQAQAG